MAVIVSRRYATLHELETVYGMGDAYDMLEILAVDNRNKEIAQQHAERGA